MPGLEFPITVITNHEDGSRKSHQIDLLAIGDTTGGFFHSLKLAIWDRKEPASIVRTVMVRADPTVSEVEMPFFWRELDELSSKIGIVDATALHHVQERLRAMRRAVEASSSYAWKIKRAADRLETFSLAQPASDVDLAHSELFYNNETGVFLTDFFGNDADYSYVTVPTYWAGLSLSDMSDLSPLNLESKMEDELSTFVEDGDMSLVVDFDSLHSFLVDWHTKHGINPGWADDATIAEPSEDLLDDPELTGFVGAWNQKQTAVSYYANFGRYVLQEDVTRDDVAAALRKKISDLKAKAAHTFLEPVDADKLSSSPSFGI